MSTLVSGRKTGGNTADLPLNAAGTAVVTEGSGSGGAAVAASDADSNATTMGQTIARVTGFNGTTWDRIRTAITTVSSTLTGFMNTLPWALYHSSPVTRTNGQGGPLETDATGNLRSAEQYVTGWSFSNIITNTTTVVKSGAGVMKRITVNTLGTTPTITVYDNTAASGTKIATIILPAAGAGDMPMAMEFDVAFATGLTVVTSAACDLTVVYL